MIDLHCHILPALDDGPDTQKESLQMAESAAADGITHVVATPHSNEEYAFDYAHVRKLRDELQRAVGTRLAISTGCDFHMSPENLAALRTEPAKFCINQHSYLLVEFNEFSIPPSMDQTLHELRVAGIHPVITHPERNRILCADPQRLVGWIRLGCHVQVTGGSLTGNFGKTARERALSWIGRGMVHFVASDAHNTKGRPLVLKPAYQAVQQDFGKGMAEALFVKNPAAALEGQTLPYVAHVQDVRKTKKRFWLF